ncbi:MAG: hypothetical protein JXL97_09340 [Bacteroidales bacterium]|nr:hypothetical protein [Bacteroidales bacterium]
MKKLLLLSLVFSLLAFGCKNSDKTNNNKDNNLEAVEDFDFSNVDKIERVNLVYLPEIVAKESDEFQQKFNLYLDAFNSEITSGKQLEAIIRLRDSLLIDMEGVIEEYYWDEGEADWDKWVEVEKELDTIGFWSIYAEGMYVGMDVASILQAEINKFASDDFKLYMDFRNAYAMSLGGEYPYMSLMPYYNVVTVGEKFYKDFQDSKYYDLIKDKYMWSLLTIVDIHYVNLMNDGGCFNGGFNFSFWPFATSCDDWEYIVEEYPNSIFIPVIKNLINNMSEIDVDYENDGNLAEVYVVVTDKVTDYMEANYKIFDYLHQGIDIVHPLAFKNDGVDESYVAYRFYSNKQKAQESLDYILSVAPDAQIFKVRLEEEYDNPVVLEIL